MVSWWKALKIVLLLNGIAGYVTSAAKCFDMLPQGDIFVVAGEDVYMNCTVKGTSPDCQNIISDFDIYNVTIRKGSQVLPLSLFTYHVQEKTVTLTLPNVTFDDRGNYWCQYRGEARAIKLLEIGAPPNAPENLKCVSNNLRDLVCFFTWNEDPNGIPVSWTMKYQLGPTEFADVTCTRQSRNTFLCQKCPEHLFYDHETYQLQLIGFNRSFNIQVELESSVYVDKSIVKPDPVRNLGYELIGITRTAELRWLGPGELVWKDKLLFPMDYKIHVTSEWDNRIEWINNTMDESGSYDEASSKQYNLTGLIPFCNYTVTVLIKPVAAQGEIYWSNASVINFTTPAEVSDHSVTVSPGSFMLRDNEQGMNVILYWKNPRVKYWNGEITGYKFVIRNMENNRDSVAVKKRGIEDLLEYNHQSESITESIQGGVSESMALKTILSKKDYHQVEILLVNSEGVSWNKAEIEIPDWLTGEKLKPQWVLVETWESEVYMSWYIDPAYCDMVTSITYFWCTPDHFNTSFTTCKENLDWYTVKTADGCGNNVSRRLNVAENHDNVKYAVSMATNSSVSGMKWENFHFKKDEVPAKPLFTVAPEGTSLKVVILYDEYVSGGGKPARYTVVYIQCEQDKDCIANNPGSTKNKDFLANFSHTAYTVSNLEPGTYQVQVNSENDAGVRPGDPQTVVLHYGSETNSTTTLGIVLGIIAGIIVVAVVIVCLRRKYKVYQLKSQIKLPTHSEYGLDGSFLEMGKDKPIKAADDHDSGKGSDSLGSSKDQLNEPQEAPEGEVSETELTNSEKGSLETADHLPSFESTDTQSFSGLPGYMGINQSCLCEIEDQDYSSIVPESSKSNTSYSDPTRDLSIEETTNINNENQNDTILPPTESAASKTDVNIEHIKSKIDLVCKQNISQDNEVQGTDEMLKSPVDYSKASVKTGTKVCEDDSSVEEGGNNVIDEIQVDHLKSQVKSQTHPQNTELITMVTETPQPSEMHRITASKDRCIEPSLSSKVSEIVKYDSTELPHTDSDLQNVKSTNAAPEIHGLDKLNGLNTVDTHSNDTQADVGSQLDSSAPSDDCTLSFEDLIDNSGMVHYKNPNDFSCDGSTISDVSDSESVEDELNSEDRWIDKDALTNQTIVVGSVEDSKTIKENTANVCCATNEKDGVQDYDILKSDDQNKDVENDGSKLSENNQNTVDVDDRNTTLSNGRNSSPEFLTSDSDVYPSASFDDTTQIDTSGQDNSLSGQSRSIGDVSLQSYMKTGCVLGSDNVLNFEKIDETVDKENLKKDALKKLVGHIENNTVEFK